MTNENETPEEELTPEQQERVKKLARKVSFEHWQHAAKHGIKKSDFYTDEDVFYIMCAHADDPTRGFDQLIKLGTGELEDMVLGVTE